VTPFLFIKLTQETGGIPVELMFDFYSVRGPLIRPISVLVVAVGLFNSILDVDDA